MVPPPLKTRARLAPAGGGGVAPPPPAPLHTPPAPPPCFCFSPCSPPRVAGWARAPPGPRFPAVSLPPPGGGGVARRRAALVPARSGALPAGGRGPGGVGADRPPHDRRTRGRSAVGNVQRDGAGAVD